MSKSVLRSDGTILWSNPYRRRTSSLDRSVLHCRQIRFCIRDLGHDLLIPSYCRKLVFDLTSPFNLLPTACFCNRIFDYHKATTHTLTYLRQLFFPSVFVTWVMPNLIKSLPAVYFWILVLNRDLPCRLFSSLPSACLWLCELICNILRLFNLTAGGLFLHSWQGPGHSHVRQV